MTLHRLIRAGAGPDWTRTDWMTSIERACPSAARAVDIILDLAGPRAPRGTCARRGGSEIRSHRPTTAADRPRRTGRSRRSGFRSRRE
ncbi:hypothetical protein EF294_01895 [Gordonia oryzae]|uniref:Uncharacterized protein n=1 Tax=Gordonia oryzae TaxID=2487349 RepID=A0A3N4GY13_9ACTN|nr:hypothetical protein EF294_01895 [Gordonia oryzae]